MQVILCVDERMNEPNKNTQREKNQTNKQRCGFAIADRTSIVYDKQNQTNTLTSYIL